VWLLAGTTRRGKNADAGVDGAVGSGADRQPVGGGAGYHASATTSRRVTRWLQRNELARFYRYRQRNLLPPLKNQQRC